MRRARGPESGAGCGRGDFATERPVQIMFRFPKSTSRSAVARFRPVRGRGRLRIGEPRRSGVEDPDAFSLERSDLKAKPHFGFGTAFTSAWVQGLHAWKLHAP